MGARGRKPTPTAVLKARGSWRAKLNPHEPVAAVEAPDCPGWLSDEARLVWYAIVPMLLSLKVLYRADGNALARYCDAFVKWRRAATELDKVGMVYAIKDATGRIIGAAPSPHHGIYDRYARILDRLEASFGLTPSARTRIAAGLEPADSVAEDDARLLKLIPSRVG